MWPRVEGLRGFALGEPGPMRERLTALVLDGRKTATGDLLQREYLDQDEVVDAVGERQALLDDSGDVLAIIEVTRVEICRFLDVSWAFASAEGEGFTSVEDWRSGHRSYFARHGVDVGDDDLFVCVWFRVVEVRAGGVTSADAATSVAVPLRVVSYQQDWPTRFAALEARLGGVVSDGVLRIDHIGSTSVPGLAAKDVIDVQITVLDLAVADEWPDELDGGLVREQLTLSDHVPPGRSGDGEWSKRLWSRRGRYNVHVRELGRANQRYALLFRDFLRADPLAAAAYGELKRALIERCPQDWDAYYAVKDPACDLIMAGAEQWAIRTGWQQQADG